METLRAEVLQAQRTRSELLKWKLGLVGAIGAIGLGFAGSRTSAHVDLVLCAVPPVCLYVDLLCRHLTLRMLVISAFFQRNRARSQDWEAIKEYEKLAGAVRENRDAFALESWAVSGSTAAVSGAVFFYGVLLHGDDAVHIAFMLSGFIAGAFTLFASVAYDGRCAALAVLAKDPHAKYKVKPLREWLSERSGRG
jgi:hypothetical protein